MRDHGLIVVFRPRNPKRVLLLEGRGSRRLRRHRKEWTRPCTRLTPVFFSQRQDRTYALRELGGFEWGSKLYASFNADVPKSEFGRYEIVRENGERVPLISESVLAP